MTKSKTTKTKTKSKSKKAPAKKKSTGWGGRREGSGGRVLRTVAEKLLLGLRVRPVDYEREGLPVPQSRNAVRALKQAAEKAKAGILPAPEGKTLRCHRRTILPRCGACQCCLDYPTDPYWESEDEKIVYLFGGSL